MCWRFFHLIFFSLFNFNGALDNYFVGRDDGDLKMRNIVEEKINLSKPFLGKDVIYVSKFGVVSFAPINSSYITIPSTGNHISLYFREDVRFTRIGIVESPAKQMLSKIEQVVRASAKIDNFLADSAFIMNFEQVFDSRNTNEFQVVLVNGMGSYNFVIVNYKKLCCTHALVGYSIHKDKYDVLIPPVRSKELVTSTNCGLKGRHLINLSVRELLHEPKYEQASDLDRTYFKIPKQIMNIEDGIPFVNDEVTSELFISKDGILAGSIQNVTLDNLKSKLYNCVFIGDVKSIASSHNVTIGYKTLTENRWKKKCGTQVSKFTGHPFPTEEMILIEVVSKGKEERLFVVVCSDGNNTYLILQRNFHLEKFVLGISQKSCNWDTFESSKRWGNTGLVGEYIFKVNSPCNETVSDEKENEDKGEGNSSQTIRNYGLIVGISVAVATIFIVCVLVFIIYSRRSKNTENLTGVDNASFKKNVEN